MLHGSSTILNILMPLHKENFVVQSSSSRSAFDVMTMLNPQAGGC